MKKIPKSHICFFLFFVMFSCNGDKKKLVDDWVVEELKIKHSTRSIKMAYNLLSFAENGVCQLPQINWYDNRNGTWEFIKRGKSSFLMIKSQNIFNGNYVYTFYNDRIQHEYKMRLTSDSVDMVCSKFLTPYNE